MNRVMPRGKGAVTVCPLSRSAGPTIRPRRLLWGIFGFQDAGHLLVSSNTERATTRPGALRLPHRIYRLDIKTGKAELWKEIGGQLPRAGLMGTSHLTFNADGKSYIYNNTTDPGTLYNADGLR